MHESKLMYSYTCIARDFIYLLFFFKRKEIIYFKNNKNGKKEK